MDMILVKGGKRLEGAVKVEGAKNAVLPILTASILASEGINTFHNVPALSDVDTISHVLKGLNVNVQAIDENTYEIDATGKLDSTASYEYVSKMRASILVMGPLLARLGHARVALPGGCAIGSRPIEQHLKGLTALGAVIQQENGYLVGTANGRLKGARIYLDFPSVGATQNILMAATLAEGTTIMENVAREPEIVDLADFLNGMGARIKGAGSDTLVIEGVEHLKGTDHTIIADRIEAGTFMIAAAITRGDVLVQGARKDHMSSLISKLTEMGVSISEQSDGLRVSAVGALKGVEVQTMPHPGFPTDMQAQMTALMMTGETESRMTETVFENRFMHIDEFIKMNGNLQVKGRTAYIKKSQLHGASVKSTDLRAAAALILAGLVADGYTRVSELKHLDRGYVNFHGKLKALGADIERTQDKEAVKVR
ncbi:UDP-N-acetylglucosamine 1-carboxyvinyltransferase [Macrococcus hajekii]|uniref:UDP-N-acetylglucosamine 1-carboxyvinyltransferase n=1 Tax=Macrococcus hajekii TaxID=198482 RepID=A0A4R6BHU7_9STAP|nr:UDP-N-acetylglucosamine 1-carboxyvinyltransferase [Macrococcus hajekii]TDM01098.1 UDP-N-acetylglucosamine 1-carboxyvinyltransferase [Macrococcus hajekii]GGB12410.1 UDP-N-acetylglucosamine 1-carboxyvinyltransferase [Macrococcus hajekii]